MISTRFCPVCGAANEETHTHCFACGQVLPTGDQEKDEHEREGTLLAGRYRLGTTLGSGGYSAVYRGVDEQEGGRAVAVKQISLRGLDAEETIEATNTYNREVDALSALNHPQVPHLYDHFSDADHWYLVLEYIEGQTLESYLERRESQGKPLQLEEILGMALQLCVVLTYLHGCHPPVIYRDLKPSNIMRTPGGKLYLIDFGIARRYTPGRKRDTQSLGSPGYAAPEQYGKAQTDARADIYSLGALLHQLLSGEDPLERKPGLLPQRYRGQAGSGELGKLAARMLAIDPLYRPASAQDVARELERIRQQRASALNSRRIWVPPVPQNTPYPTGGGPQIQIQRSQQPVALPKRKRFTRRRVVSLIGVASLATIGFGVGRYLILDSQSSNAAYPHLYTYTGHRDAVHALAWSPDGKRIASASDDATVRVWDALDGGNTYVYAGHTSAVEAIAWSSTSSSIISGGSDGKVRLWSPDPDGPDYGLLAVYAAPVDALAWSPDYQTGSFAAGTEDSVVIVSNISDYQVSHLTYQVGPITSVAYSPDGWYLASGSQDKTVDIWDPKTHERVYVTYQGHTGAVNSIIWLPNGVYIASASTDSTVQIWDVTTGAMILTYTGHMQSVNALAVSPDGQYIASASDDSTVHVWSVDDGSPLLVYRGHTEAVTSVAWSPDGQYIVSGSNDKTAQVWYAPKPPSS